MLGSYLIHVGIHIMKIRWYTTVLSLQWGSLYLEKWHLQTAPSAFK